MSRTIDRLREEGLASDAFREGYEARDALIRLGTMLRTIREASGLTQEQLAQKVGMAQPAVSRLEAGFGRKGPELETVMRFVHGCEMELVLQARPKPASAEELPVLAAAVAHDAQRAYETAM